MRVCSKTTTLPRSRSSWILAKFNNKRDTCFSGCRSDPLRKRMIDGLLCFQRARSVPKSVSEEIRIRFSIAARLKIISSSAACNPYSRTCTASCPARRNPSATQGDNALSTNNFIIRSPMEALSPELLQPHTAKLHGCPLAPDQDKLVGFLLRAFHPQPSPQLLLRECVIRECRELLPFDGDQS